MKGILWIIPVFIACGTSPHVQVVKDRNGRVRAEVSRVHGRKEGPVRFFAEDGTLTTTGAYVDDSRHGAWITTGPQGDTVSIVQFNHGRKNGLQAYWADNGQLLRIEEFAAGAPHGTLYRFFADGSPRQITSYIHGEAEGPYLEWYKVDSTSVALTFGQFHAAERTGHWTWFYGNGRPARHGGYVDGKPTGTWCFWKPDGRLAKVMDRGKP